MFVDPLGDPRRKEATKKPEWGKFEVHAREKRFFSLAEETGCHGGWEQRWRRDGTQVPGTSEMRAGQMVVTAAGLEPRALESAERPVLPAT